MFKWFDTFLKPYQVTGEDCNENSLGELFAQLAKHVQKNQERITKLEAENVELTNCLYEVENRLQAQIDKIHPVTYNLNNYGLEK
jgi:predicted  nucleic acid-binding Zn-ribbon protein